MSTMSAVRGWLALLALCAFAPASAQVKTAADDFSRDKPAAAQLVRVFRKDGRLYVTLDNVRIEYRDRPSGEAERVIVNDNPRLRTYEVPASLEAVDAQCQAIPASTLQAALESRRHGNAPNLVLYASAGGRLIFLNTGCWE